MADDRRKADRVMKLKIAIGCIMLFMLFFGMFCGMCHTVGWKEAVAIWSISLALVVWVGIAVFMIF